jgi:hypothetical protein
LQPLSLLNYQTAGSWQIVLRCRRVSEAPLDLLFELSQRSIFVSTIIAAASGDPIPCVKGPSCSPLLQSVQFSQPLIRSLYYSI